MAAFQGDAIFWIETHKIVPNPYQPRREFDEQKLKELSESIRMYGVLQPLTVSRKEVSHDDGAFKTEYELIAGERRLRASKLAGIEQVPVIIREGEESEQEKLELAIIENLQREDLNAVDRALAFKQLAETFKLSHGQVAKKVGRSREYVSNSIRLLQLPEYMLESVKTADITEGHARTLLMLNDRPEEQDTLYRETLMKKLTVREVERIARKIATDKVRVQKWKGSDPELIEKEKQFTETLGTRVQLVKTDYGGKITIDYFSDEDLDTLLGTLAHGKSNDQAVSPVTSAAAAVDDTTANTTLDTLVTATALEVPKEAPTAPKVPAAPETISPAQAPEHKESETEPAAPTTDEVLVEQPPQPPAEKPEHTTDREVAQEQPGPKPVGTPNKIAPEAASSLRSKLAQLFGEPNVEAEVESTPVPSDPQTSAARPEPTTPAPEAGPVPTPATEEAEVPSASTTSIDPDNAPEQKPTEDDDLYGVRHFGI